MKRAVLLLTMMIFPLLNLSAMTTFADDDKEMVFKRTENHDFEKNLKVNTSSHQSINENVLTLQALKETVWYAELSCGKTVLIIADVDSVREMVDITMAVDLIVCGDVYYHEVL